MTAHSLAPAFMRLFYTSGSTPHAMTLQVDFASPPVVGFEPTLTTKDGTGVSALLAVNAFTTVCKPFFRTTDVFTGVEIYSQPTPTDDPLFIWADDLIVTGSSASPTIQNGQIVFTYGTGAGGLLKLYLMEPTIVPDQRIPNRTSAVGGYGAFTTYVLGPSSFIKGRDDAFAVRGIYITTKINDTLRKKQLLDQ